MHVPVKISPVMGIPEARPASFAYCGFKICEGVSNLSYSVRAEAKETIVEKLGKYLWLLMFKTSLLVAVVPLKQS